jgi:hypothetical protein
MNLGILQRTPVDASVMERRIVPVYKLIVTVRSLLPSGVTENQSDLLFPS